MKYGLLLLFCLPISLAAQADLVGTWAMVVPDQNQQGKMITVHVTMDADNNYSIDFGADNKVEIKGTYSVDGGKITIQDAEGEECTGKGIYRFKVTPTDLIMKRESDECEMRGGPDGILRMRKV